MAATSTSRSWSGFARRAVAVSAVAATALLAFAAPASAHTPKFDAGCKESVGKTFLKVELKNYQKKDGDEKPNSVKVTDGDQVLVDDKFGKNFEKVWGELDATKDHSFKVVVKAWDDAEGKEGWSTTWEKKVEACKDAEQPPTEEPPTEEPPTEEPPSETPSTSPTTTTTTEVPVGANANLAETGASITIPIVIGGVLLAGGAVMLFIVRKRSKA